MTDSSTLFGRELRRYRLAAGLSLTGLAELVHYSKGHLGKIETGDKRAGIDLARLCDAALDAGGELAAMVTEDRVEPSSPAPVAEADDEVLMMTFAPDGTSWLVPMNRRQALAAGAVSLMATKLTPGALPAGARQESTIAAFKQLFNQSRKLGQMASPGIVLPTVVAQGHTVRGMAKSASGPQQIELLRLAARYQEYAGWLAQEAGDDRAALNWTNAAVDLADAAEDRDLAAHGLIRRALITLYRDDARQTIELAAQAQASNRASARTRGQAALREAQGHALAGDYDSCRRALDRAAVLLAAGEQPGELALGQSSVTDLTSMVTGWCLHDLGRPGEAAEILDDQVSRIPADSLRAHARFGTRQALAHASAGEVDHACGLAHGVLNSAEVVDSATIRTDLRRLARTLARWHNHGEVRILQERLSAALHVPIQ
ncbi:XRE family transcriptional regulator [Pseudonocardiaceae bacterium YIM PH 21723]|nr:XRE family transcriptional regulator [Pseudonocardiaceae bacterium YIM PH 21723]